MGLEAQETRQNRRRPFRGRRAKIGGDGLLEKRPFDQHPRVGQALRAPLGDFHRLEGADRGELLLDGVAHEIAQHEGRDCRDDDREGHEDCRGDASPKGGGELHNGEVGGLHIDAVRVCTEFGGHRIGNPGNDRVEPVLVGQPQAQHDTARRRRIAPDHIRIDPLGQPDADGADHEVAQLGVFEVSLHSEGEVARGDRDGEFFAEIVATCHAPLHRHECTVVEGLGVLFDERGLRHVPLLIDVEEYRERDLFAVAVGELREGDRQLVSFGFSDVFPEHVVEIHRKCLFVRDRDQDVWALELFKPLVDAIGELDRARRPEVDQHGGEHRE